MPQDRGLRDFKTPINQLDNLGSNFAYRIANGNMKLSIEIYIMNNEYQKEALPQEPSENFKRLCLFRYYINLE